MPQSELVGRRPVEHNASAWSEHVSRVGILLLDNGQRKGERAILIHDPGGQ